MTNLVWFRSDLRVSDNLALQTALDSGATLGCVFLPVDQLGTYGHGEKKIEFLRSACFGLKEKLQQAGVEFIYEETGNFQDQMALVQKVCRQKEVQSVFWNNEYPLDERHRDAQLTELLHKDGIQVKRFDENLIIPPGQISNNEGQMYKVFTPFKRAWLAHFNSDRQSYRNRLDTQWLEGAQALHREADNPEPLLIDFCKSSAHNYHEKRDFPAVSSTSMLSAHLSVGSISPLRALGEALRHNNGETDSGDPGILAWVSQLIWREFYYHLVSRCDRISRNKAFQPKTERVQWHPPGEKFERWCEGQTGVPIVDAGMRQLNHTGWMHNRLRMITAMFLTKNLLIDWRMGERYFLDKLIDGDFALNNGGWQWSASTGTDAAPYFRIFNPFSQAKRFDPSAEFIKAYVPELAPLPADLIHSEQKLKQTRPAIYPSAIVDTKESRLAAIEAFSKILKENSPEKN